MQMYLALELAVKSSLNIDNMAKALIYKNGVATYVELPDIEPSAEDIRAGYLSEIESLKAQLVATDYKAIKFAEGELSATDYEPIRIQRRALRQRINELETLITPEG